MLCPWQATLNRVARPAQLSQPQHTRPPAQRVRSTAPDQPRRALDETTQMGWKVRAPLRLGSARWMTTGSLGDEQYEQDYRPCEYRSCQGPTKFESALRNRLVEKVAHCGAQGAREDEGSPKEQNPRNIG